MRKHHSQIQPHNALDLSVRVLVRSKVPTLPIEKIVTHILGNNYSLSLVFCGDSLSRNLNISRRQKYYYPNILTFPLSRSSGEIFINMRKAEREARAQKIPLREHTLHLLIHGCLHLSGMEHSDTMDSMEARLTERFLTL